MPQPPTPQAIAAARAAFPRGLVQPEGSLRFGLDALLLAAFAAPLTRRARRPLRVAELGCGCGAALLALALSWAASHSPGLAPNTLTDDATNKTPGTTTNAAARKPHANFYGAGLEREAILVEAARTNAALLGLEHCLHFYHTDLAQLSEPEKALWAQDMVLANPPYALPGQGRPSPKVLRERALRGSETRDIQTHAHTAHSLPRAHDPLLIFCQAAARLLRHHGHFFCIFQAAALPRLCAALEHSGLGLRRIVPLRSRRQLPALRLLVEARKGAAHDLRLESPLTLHPPQQASNPQPGNEARPLWTAQALRFCPWLHRGLGLAESAPAPTASAPRTAAEAFNATGGPQNF